MGTQNIVAEIDYLDRRLSLGLNDEILDAHGNPILVPQDQDGRELAKLILSLPELFDDYNKGFSNTENELYDLKSLVEEKVESALYAFEEIDEEVSVDTAMKKVRQVLEDIRAEI